MCRVLVALLVMTLSAVTSLAAEPPPLRVVVYGNHALDDASIIKMSGIDQDPTLSAMDVKRRLQTTSMFSKINVTRTKGSMRIIVKEKTNWFVVPYLSFGADSNVYGLALGKSSVLGQNANVIGCYQSGGGDSKGMILVRDEFFMNTPFSLGVSLDYEDALHRIYHERKVVQRTTNQYHGGSIQLGYHLNPYAAFMLNNFIERHRFEEPSGNYVSGLQVSHQLSLLYGTFSTNEGLTRGAAVRGYYEITNPWADFQFRKVGVSGQVSVFLKNDFNWIVRPEAETGSGLPRCQQFELGGYRLRSYPVQQFRDRSYFSVQNDVLLTSWNIRKIKLRTLTYVDWAFVQNSGRTGLGAGLQVYLREVAIPAVQIFAGYGFNPNGFSAVVSIGPQF